MSTIQVYSEIGKLSKVLLHRPGSELYNLTPTNMERLLFDDLPDGRQAGKEHDAFAEVLQSCGVTPVYIEDMMASILEDREVKRQFVRDFLLEGEVDSANIEPLLEWLLSFEDNKKLVDILISGIRNNSKDLPVKLPVELPQDRWMVLDPLPNLYFMRDCFSFIGRGVSLNHMHTKTRQRESLLGSYMFKFHPDFAGITRLYDRDKSGSLEGGDILVLSEQVLAIGVSERTSNEAVEILSQNLFRSEPSFQTVLAFKIPSKRAFMHLDTVFTMIDYDVFTIHPEIESPMEIYEIKNGKSGIDIKYVNDSLEHILARYLKIDHPRLIRCGGGDPVDAQREQWADGSNTLAVAPGEIIVYNRNYVTNELLEKEGVKLHRIISGELSRGRGGPRCMSMPMWRERIS